MSDVCIYLFNQLYIYLSIQVEEQYIPVWPRDLPDVCIYLSKYISVSHLSIQPSIYLSIQVKEQYIPVWTRHLSDVCIYPTKYLSIYPTIYLSRLKNMVFLCGHGTCQMCLYVCLSIYLIIYLSNHLYIYLIYPG